jgi:glycosyltransferase involved in cell wall biosynthesis
VAKIVATMLVRNEEWVLRASLRTALKWADEVVVINHGSTDDTENILARAFKETGRVFHRTIKAGLAWDEMDLRQELLVWARTRDATHVALVDADEIVTENLVPMMRAWVERLAPREQLRLPMIAPWGNLERYRDDASTWSNAASFIVACDHPTLHWKAREDGYQLHHREPYEIGAVVQPLKDKKTGGFFHLQWSSWRRLVAKHAHYRVTERLRYPRKASKLIEIQYSQAPKETDPKCSSIPSNWWDPETKTLIDLNHEPWHEEEVLRLIAKHGKREFKGLNLEFWGD